jgi:antitoxin CptB
MEVIDHPDELIGERQLSRLRWSCRRGLLENDLFIERFFKRFETKLTVTHAQALSALMDLSDNDLLDLHLARREIDAVSPALDRPDVRDVLSMLRATC